MDGWEDVEYLNFNTSISVENSDYTAGEGNAYSNAAAFEGVVLLDVDRIVDRHEVATLLWANTQAKLVALSTSATDETDARCAVELSASAGRQIANRWATEDDASVIDDQVDLNGDLTGVAALVQTDDSADLIHRVLQVGGGAAQADDTNGVGSSPSIGTDEAWGPPPGSWDFDRRDNLYVNGTVEISGGTTIAFGVNLVGTLVFGITED